MSNDRWEKLEPHERNDFFTIINGANKSIKLNTYWDIIDRIIISIVTLIQIILICINDTMFTEKNSYFEYPLYIISGSIHFIIITVFTIIQFKKAYKNGNMLNMEVGYASWYNTIMETSPLKPLSIIICCINVVFFIWAWMIISNKSRINWQQFMHDYPVNGNIYLWSVIYWTVQIIIQFVINFLC